jgi:predicted acetyltransferase
MLKIATATHSERHSYGWRAVWEEVEIFRVRAYRFSGVGSAVITYEGQDSNGKWYKFLKKDQTSAVKRKLPVFGSFPNTTQICDESRPYARQCRHDSNPVEV